MEAEREEEEEGGRRREGKEVGKKRGVTWLRFGEAAAHGEWPSGGQGAGAQMVGCGRLGRPWRGWTPHGP